MIQIVDCSSVATFREPSYAWGDGSDRSLPFRLGERLMLMESIEVLDVVLPRGSVYTMVGSVTRPGWGYWDQDGRTRVVRAPLVTPLLQAGDGQIYDAASVDLHELLRPEPAFGPDAFRPVAARTAVAC